MEFLKQLLEIIQAFFKDKEIVQKKTETPVSTNFRNYNVLTIAAGEIGEKEIVGTKDNPQVVEYLAWGGSSSNTAKHKDEVPWCAGFVGWCLEKAGMTSTNSLGARSYESWGRTYLKDPLPGDVVTFWRTSLASGKGHVGIFLKREGNYVWVLGGNQSNAVNVAKMSTNQMTDIRRSSKAGVYTVEQRNALKALAEKIISGKKIDTSGAVV